MNAVTTAEYQVLEHYNAVELQHMINEHTTQGYKLLHYCAVPDEGNRCINYNAVMVREPANSLAEAWQARMAEWEEAFKKYTQRVSAAFDPEKHFEQIAMLQHSVEAQRDIKKLTARIAELEKQVNDITDKIDWSK